MTYERRLTAFIDILGFKSLVEQSFYDPATLSLIDSAMKLILKQRNMNDQWNKIYDDQKRITTFSDSIVISCPASKGSGNLFYIILDCIHIQMELAFLGILVRGGISIGPLYHDGDIVYGPAMNEAYRLESQIAKHPRIIVSKETLVEGLKRTCSAHHTVEQEAEFIDGLIKDCDDGWFFLDMLSQSQELDYPEGDYYVYLATLRKVIIEGLRNCDAGVVTKFRWFKHYFNNTLEEMKSFPDTSDWYEGDGISLYQSLKVKEKDYA